MGADAAQEDAKLLEAPFQGRALETFLGWYRLQENWTALTNVAVRDLTTPEKGLHETRVDLVLWRTRQHKRGQCV